MVSKKLTKKQQRKLELLRLKQDPAFFLRERIKGLNLPEHLQKFFYNQSLNDLLTMGIGIWAAYATQEPRNFLTGALAYKLATTQGGTPPVSQIAGLGMLGLLGLSAIPTGFREEYLEQTAPHYPDWWPFKSEARKKMFIP